MKKLADPEAWWSAIEPLLGDRRFAIPLVLLALAGSLIVTAASEVGIRIFNTDWDNTLGYAVQRNRSWQSFFALWVGFALTTIVQGLVGAALLKVYSKPQRWLRGIAVAVVGSVPMYIGGLTLVLLPGILLFAIAFLISCAWWASGNRRLLGLSFNEAPEHVAVSLVVSGAFVVLMTAGLPF